MGRISLILVVLLCYISRSGAQSTDTYNSIPNNHYNVTTTSAKVLSQQQADQGTQMRYNSSLNTGTIFRTNPRHLVPLNLNNSDNCADKQYMRTGQCEDCPQSATVLLLLFVVITLAAVTMGYLLRRRQASTTAWCIGVDYIQVLALFVLSDIDWPNTIDDILFYMSSFNLNIEVAAPECTFKNVDAESKWYLTLLLPILAALFLFLIFATHYLFKRFIKGRKGRRNLCSHGSTLLGSFTSMMYFMYLFLTRAVFDAFNCLQKEDDSMELVGICASPRLHSSITAVAIVALVVYTIGFPITIGYIVYKYRFEMMEDQLLRARGTGFTRLSNPHCYDIRKTYYGIYGAYKPDFVFWTFVVLARKLCIALVILIFNQNPAFQFSVSLVVLVSAMAAQLRFRPYMSDSDMNFVLWDHSIKAETNALHEKLAVQLKDVDMKGRKQTTRVNWSTPNPSTSKGNIVWRSKVRIGNWMYDYNALEACLLFCAILVNLSGIMFESVRDTSIFDGQRDAATVIAIVVIVGSLCYFIGILVAEIWAANQSGNADELEGSDIGSVDSPRLRRLSVLSLGESPTAAGLFRPKSARRMSGLELPASRRTNSERFLSVNGLEPTVTSSNPMFAAQKRALSSSNVLAEMNATAESKDGVSDFGISNIDAILQLTHPPAPAVWQQILNRIQDFKTQMEEMREQLKHSKQQLAQNEITRERADSTKTPNSRRAGRSSIVGRKKISFENSGSLKSQFDNANLQVANRIRRGAQKSPSRPSAQSTTTSSNTRSSTADDSTS